MQMMNRLLALATVTCIALAAPAFAQSKRIDVAEDGLVRFSASTTGITRISVVGQRIKQIISDSEETDFQSRADEDTGDLFLRYSGVPGEKARREGGYLITEKGMTIAYLLMPVEAPTQTVLINIKPNAARASATQPSDRKSEGFAETSFGGAGGGFVETLTSATRETINKTIRSTRPTGGSNNSLVRTVPIGDLIGELRVARAGSSGRLVREQEFYRPGVLSVWVQDTQLSANERSWVVVVKNKR